MDAKRAQKTLDTLVDTLFIEPRKKRELSQLIADALQEAFDRGEVNGIVMFNDVIHDCRKPKKSS